MRPGQTVAFALSAEPAFETDRQTGLVRPHSSLVRCQMTAEARVSTLAEHLDEGERQTPAAVKQLALAADQFIVSRPTDEDPDGHTVIAGYPWFTDWGRDTMIALPGLTLCTGRPDLARQILRTWSRYVDQGLIPNRFPEAGDRPEYHTADATLWFLWAIDQYVCAAGGQPAIEEFFPVMAEIVDWHVRGTRHNIHVDDDGLLYAGEQGLNLTWMDAKIGDRVITPRIGKPVELMPCGTTPFVTWPTTPRSLKSRRIAIGNWHSAPGTHSIASGTPSAAAATTCSTARTGMTRVCGRIRSSPCRSRTRR